MAHKFAPILTLARRSPISRVLLLKPLITRRIAPLPRVFHTLASLLRDADYRSLPEALRALRVQLFSVTLRLVSVTQFRCRLAIIYKYKCIHL